MRKVALVWVYLLLFLPLISIGQWKQLGIDLDGKAAGDEYGLSNDLSADGTRVAIGGYGNDDNGMNTGHVRVFDWDGMAWNQVGGDIYGVNINENSGISVSLNADGNVLAIRSGYINSGNLSIGRTRIFEWNGTIWVQRGGNIDGVMPSIGNNSTNLNADGNIVVIGEAAYSSPSSPISGRARIFEWNGTAWIQRGTDINGVNTQDFFGVCAVINAVGNTVAVSSIWDHVSSTGAGYVRVFDWDGLDWIQRGVDIYAEVIPSHAIGSSMSYSAIVTINADGNVIAIGVSGNEDNGMNAGHLRVFDWSGGAWVQRGADIDGENPGDRFGSKVSISADGNTVAAGVAILNSNGNIRIFDWDGSAWVLDQKIDGENLGDYFGIALNLSADGSTVAVGANLNDGNGVDAGHVRVFANGVINLAAKIFLHGPSNTGSGLMNDDLRINGLIPITDPYGLGKTITNPSVLAITGNDAIVDWVEVELRDQIDPTKIMQRTAALLQRDGDVVDVDGVSILKFCGLIGRDYLIAIRHRNHLGALATTPVTAQ